jgi:glycolate oxidase iron-sulfur subunit
MAVAAPAPQRQTLLARLVETADAACIKCGFCLPKCPTYRLTGVESASPRGRIHLMKMLAKGRLRAEEIDAQLDFCLGCRACETACPAGVKFGKLLEAGREQTLQARTAPWFRRWGERLFFSGLLLHLKRLDLLVDLLWLYQVSGLQRLVRRSRLLPRLFPTLADWELLLPELPPPRLRRRLPVYTPAEGEERRRVGLVAGCVMRSLFADANRATVRVLAKNGCAVITPWEQVCCGALHAHRGDLATARRLARRNLEVFGALEIEAVIVNSAGCGAMLKEYGHLLADDPLYAERAAAFSRRVRDISEFLAGQPLRGPLGRLPLRVAYDDPCHLVHGQGIGREPRLLLQQIPGLELVPFPEADWCCGSAGVYNLTHPETARQLLDRKLRHIAAARPDVIATGNPGCLLQLGWGVRRAGLRAAVVHPVALLDRAYQLAPSTAGDGSEEGEGRADAAPDGGGGAGRTTGACKFSGPVL